MRNIVYFSSDEWESGLKTSQYHIAIGLSKGNRVLYINSVGMRCPKFNAGDALRIVDKLSRFTKGCKHIGENLYVLTPIVIPFHGNKLTRFLNQMLMRSYISYFLWKLNMRDIFIITFLPNLSHTIKSLRAQKTIYYCADQLKKFEGVPENEIELMEHNTMELTDHVLVTSKKLMNDKQQYDPIYSPHGVDFELFNSAMSKDCNIPADMKEIKKPILGFYGHVSNDWIDFDLIKKLAAYTDWSIVLIGKCAHDIPDFSSFQNVYIMGNRPYEDLPAYSKAFDVGLIPFNRNSLTEHCNPIKLKEYLAAGLPVVSTAIPEIMDYAKNVGIAKDHDEFIKLVKESLSSKTSGEIQNRVNLVRGQSWRDIVNNVENLLK